MILAVAVLCIAVIVYFDQEDCELPRPSEKARHSLFPVQEETSLPMHDGQL